MKEYYCISIPSKKSIEYLDKLLKNHCTAEIGTGQIEKVMHDLYEIQWIETKEEAEKIIDNLRDNKVYKPIMLNKEIWTDDDLCIDPEAETTLYVTMFDDETTIEYECLKNRNILELLKEYPETNIETK